MYRLDVVDARRLKDFAPLQEAFEDSFFKDLDNWSISDEEFGGKAPVQKVATYVWDDPLADLSPKIWSYHTFVKESLGIWL